MECQSYIWANSEFECGHEECSKRSLCTGRSAWKLPKKSRFYTVGITHLPNMTQQLLQTIYEEEREKNDYQFRLIQEQIKPHFLYNTLEMIKSMIDLGIYDEAGEAISTLPDSIAIR